MVIFANDNKPSKLIQGRFELPARNGQSKLSARDSYISVTLCHSVAL